MNYLLRYYSAVLQICEKTSGNIFYPFEIQFESKFGNVCGGRGEGEKVPNVRFKLAH